MPWPSKDPDDYAPDSVRGGASSQGTVTTAFADVVLTTVRLFSGDTSVATMPATVVVPAGATSVTFPIATNAPAPPTIVQLVAAIDNVPRTANLSVNAAMPARRWPRSPSRRPGSRAGAPRPGR
jgi:hypothetical protein